MASSAPPKHEGRRLSFLGTSIWTLENVDSLILPNERRKYEQHFRQLDADRDGFVQAPEGKRLLARSKISSRIIDEIWGFCNPQSSPGLSCREFTCAMHLTFQAMHVTSAQGARAPAPQQPSAAPQNGEPKRHLVPPPWLLIAQQDYKASQTLSPFGSPLTETRSLVTGSPSSKPDDWVRFSPTGPSAAGANSLQSLPRDRVMSGSTEAAGPEAWVTFDTDENPSRIQRHMSMPESQLDTHWLGANPVQTSPERQASGPSETQPAILCEGSNQRVVSSDTTPPSGEPVAGRTARVRRHLGAYKIGKRQHGRRRTRSLQSGLSEDPSLYFLESGDAVQIGEGMLSPVLEAPHEVAQPVAEPSGERCTPIEFILPPHLPSNAKSGAHYETSNEQAVSEAQTNGEAVSEGEELLKQEKELVGAIEGLKTEEAGISSELETAREEEAGLAQRLGELNGQKNEVEGRVEKGRSELQQMRCELDGKRAELVRKEDELHEVRRTLVQIETERDGLEQELRNLDKLLVEKQEQLEAERKKADGAAEQAAELRLKVQTSTTVLNEFLSQEAPAPPPTAWAPPAVQVPTSNHALPRGPLSSGTRYAAFDGEDLLKLEAELGEGSCRQMLAEDQSPGPGGFVWPAISPPITRAPTLIPRPREQQDVHVATSDIGHVTDQQNETAAEVVKKVTAVPMSPKGGILSPKRRPPPPPSQISAVVTPKPANPEGNQTPSFPQASNIQSPESVKDPNPEAASPDSSPLKMRSKAVSMTLDWGSGATDGEDSWLHLEDTNPITAQFTIDPFLALADITPAPAGVIPTLAESATHTAQVPLGAAFLSGKVHPEPEESKQPSFPLSPDSLAAPSPSAKSFLSEFSNSGGLLSTAPEAAKKPALVALSNPPSPLVQSFGTAVDATPAGYSTGDITAAGGREAAHSGGVQKELSTPGSPIQVKTPLRKPPPPPSGLKRPGVSETQNPDPGQSTWTDFGEPNLTPGPTARSAVAGEAPGQSAAGSDESQAVGFAFTGDPLSPSSDLFMKVGGLGAPAKLPTEWTELRPNPVYEPNGEVSRRRSSIGDLVQEKQVPAVAEIAPSRPDSDNAGPNKEATLGQKLVDLQGPTLGPVTKPQPVITANFDAVQAKSAPTQPTSPDSSRLNLLGDDWLPADSQLPASPVSAEMVGKTNRENAVGLRPLGDTDRKKCTAAFKKIARPGREFVSRLEAEGILSRANIKGEPFEKIWALSDRGEDGVLGTDEFCIFLLLMKAAAAKEQLPPELSTEDISRLLGHEFVVEKVARSFIPRAEIGARPAAGVTPSPGKGAFGDLVVATDKTSLPRAVVLSPNPEVSPSVYSSAPQLSPSARKDGSHGKLEGPGGEAWEDHPAKRIGAAEVKPTLEELPSTPTGKDSHSGDQSPTDSRIPSPSKPNSLPEADSPGNSCSPQLQTVRPPSVVNRPLASQTFRSASLRIRTGTEDDPDRFVGERIRRFSSQEGGISYLVGMGFGPKAAAAATAKFGSNLQGAVTWLLEQPDKGVDPADVLASTDQDPFPLTPPPETPAVRSVLNTELITSDSPPASRGLEAKARRHVAGGESRIPTPPRRDGVSPNGSPVKKPLLISPSGLRPPTVIDTSSPGARNPLERNLSIMNRIGGDPDAGAQISDGSDEEEEVAVGTEIGRSPRPASSPLSQMVGSLWGAAKAVPTTPRGQTKIEAGLVAANVERFEKAAVPARGPQFSTQLPVQVLIERVVLEDADDLRDPFLTVSVYGESGSLIEPAQNTSIVSSADERGITFATTVNLLAKCSAVPPSGTKVCFELRHFKRGETSKASSKCWTAISLEEMAPGPHTLVLFKKPVDLKAKRAKLSNGKRDVLRISVAFQQ